MASTKVNPRREKSRGGYIQPLANGRSVRFVDLGDMERVGARVRAARRMANMEKRKDLTDRVHLPRFSPALLGQIERGQRVLHEHEAEALARVLPVDADFFYATPEERRDEGAFASQLERIQLDIDKQNELLDQQAKLLAELRDVVKILPAIQKVLEALPPADEERRPGRRPARGSGAAPSEEAG
jgi:transcriptional regulator with XRE-family HTH domain